MSLKQAARAFVLFCALFLLATPALRAEVIEEVVAWVDGDIITSSELEEEEQGMMAEAYRQFAGEELDEKVEQTTRYFGADVNLDFARNYRVEKVTRQALEIPGVERVEVWTATGAELVQTDGSPPEPVAIIAPPADSQLVAFK